MNKIVVLPEPKPIKIKPNSDELRSPEYLIDSDSRSTAIEKEKQKRVITNTKKWHFTEEDYIAENQLHLLKSIQSAKCSGPLEGAEEIRGNSVLTPSQICVLQQLNQKIGGYKSQDILKHLYNPILFVPINQVIELLIESRLKCHYCKKDIKVLYEIVRDPLQWTLDRIDNDHGHNTGNLLIACLSCNLRRKTIYHERYEMTKICTNVIKLS